MPSLVDEIVACFPIVGSVAHKAMPKEPSYCQTLRRCNRYLKALEGGL